MGWLRELMAAARPPVRSFGALARSSLASAAWPAGARPGSRSLAAVFSKLDRDIDLEWLVDRPGVQHAIAGALGCQVADIRQALAPARTPVATGPARRAPLDDLRFARAIDLVEEELFPGIPASVTRPATWGRLWWRAASGSGRTLAGRWLEARGLAAYIHVETWSDARARLPARGAVYLELDRDDGGVPDAGDRPLCVVAPFAAPDGAFREIETPPVDAWLASLVEWVAPRLPTDGRFDAARTLQWLRASQLVDAPGTALGLCGLSDQLGIRALGGHGLGELAERFYRDRLTQATEAASAEASWLKRQGFAVVAGMAARALTDSDEPLEAPRDFDAWLELVPEEHRRGADLAWLRASLVKKSGAIRGSDLDKAAREIPPGAFRIVRALAGAGLLVDDGGGRLSLRPRWFVRALDAVARRALVGGSPFEWGEALLRAHAAPAVARGIAARVASGSGPVEDVLELEGDDNPAHAAALETVFRAAGLALVGGAELPPEPLEELFDAGLALAIQTGDALPLPRIRHASGSGVLADGCWLLAALAISEHLPVRRGTPRGPLRPWSGGAPPSELRRVLDGIFAAVDSGDAPLGAFAVAERLRGAVGSVAADGAPPHALELPGIALEEAQHGVLAWATLDALAPIRQAIPALQLLARARGVAWADVAIAAFQAWLDAKRPALGGSVLDPGSPDAATLWSHAPAEVLAELLAEPAAAGGQLPWDALGDLQWTAFVEAAPRAADAAWDALGLDVAWRAIPEPHARVALGSIADRRALAALWARFPDALLEHARAADVATQLALAEAAEGAHVAALVDVFAAIPEPADLPAPELDRLRVWLASRVTARDAGWRDAYALLAATERRIAPAARAG